MGGYFFSEGRVWWLQVPLVAYMTGEHAFFCVPCSFALGKGLYAKIRWCFSLQHIGGHGAGHVAARRW